MQKNNWKKCKLGDALNFRRGYDLPKDQMSGKGYPVVGSNGIIGYHKEYTTEAPCLVIGRSGNTGIPALYKYPCWAHNTTLFIDNFKGNYPRFLYYLLKTMNLQSYAAGSAVPTLNRNHIHPLDISLPPLEEQKRIAEILGSLDDKIELLQKQNKTLEDMAKALFKSWFVDFDVVRAKQKGLPKADIMREYHLTDDLYDLFPSSFADSPLGPIPSGWEVKPLSKIAVLTMGQSPAGTTYNETGEGLPFYQGRTDFGFRFPKKRIYCSAPTRIAQKGDILISVRAPVGDLNMANETCCIGRGVASIRSNISKDSFLYYAMLSAQTQFDVFNTEGTVFGSINRKDLSSFSILTPIEQLVKEFNNIIGNFDLKIEENLKQIQTLTELRDTLLPRLISGKIRV